MAPVEERETLASILTYGTRTPRTPNGSEKIGDDWNDLSLFKAKPEEFDLQGTLDQNNCQFAFSPIRS
ncbi:hypothetical protein [Nostoc commune]|nr:hypothetical protein [Nostoc commune]